MINDEEDYFHFCGRYQLVNSTTCRFANATVCIRKPKHRVPSTTIQVQEESTSIFSSSSKSTASSQTQATPSFFVVYVNAGQPITIEPKSTVEYTFAQGMVSPINMHYLFEVLCCLCLLWASLLLTA
jgi:glutathionyl-hydroquinone reductase